MLRKLSQRLTHVVSETGFTYCHCLYIDDDVQTIIETGANNRSLAEIHPENIDMVLYTHHHIDHIRGNPLFTRAKSYMHPLDAAALASLENYIHYNSLDMWQELMPDNAFVNVGDINMSPDEFARIINVPNTFEDKEFIDLGKTHLQVLHTPGHSAGHCVFWFPEQEFLYSGDICLTKAGPWYGEVYADPGQMIQSIETVIDLKPKSMLSSHINTLITDCIPCLLEYRDRILRRDERIHAFLKGKPATIHDMAGKGLIYKDYPTDWVIFWEKLMLVKHLDRLQKTGMVEPTDHSSYISV